MSHQEARALAASPTLLRALGLCKRALSAIPAPGKRKAKPTLSRSELTRLEEEIGARLHEDVLVLLALRDPLARLITGIDSTTSISEAAEDFDGSEDYVRIATVYSDPVGELLEGAHGGAYVDILVQRAPSEADATVLIVYDRDMDSAEEQTLGGYLEGVIRDAIAGRVDALAIIGDGGIAPLDPPPTLNPGTKKSVPKTGTMLVDHPKFGRGTVLTRIGDGDVAKLVIAFADSERTLLARFVTVVEEEPR